MASNMANSIVSSSPNSQAAKSASQGDAHERTNAQIKFLYYPMIRPNK